MCREGAARRLKELGTVVYLKVPLAELEERIQNLSSRGIAMEPGQTLADVLAARAPLYDKYADLTVDCGGQTLAQTAERVRLLLADRAGKSPSPQGKDVGRAEDTSALNK